MCRDKTIGLRILLTIIFDRWLDLIQKVLHEAMKYAKEITDSNLVSTNDIISSDMGQCGV